jgi:hypothetical protein
VEDDPSKCVWMENGRTLEYYLIRNGVSIKALSLRVSKTHGLMARTLAIHVIGAGSIPTRVEILNFSFFENFSFFTIFYDFFDFSKFFDSLEFFNFCGIFQFF